MFEAQFQSFDVDETPREHIAARVAALRAELARRGLDGFVLPRADKQQNETVPPSDERLKWLTGFSGSAGIAIVLADRAALFVDGRYTLQVRDQVDTSIFAIEHLIDSSPHVWLENNLEPGAKLGYDPWLHTLAGADAQAVAWAFNIRGADVAHTPLPLAFAIVPREGRPSLYVDGRKLGNEVRHALQEYLDVRDEAALAEDLAALGAAHKKVRLDEATAADALANIVTESGGKILRGADPIALMKAVKNAVEIDGARAAHRRDGAAMARFLAWLDREAPGGKLTEIDAVAALETFRRETGVLKDVSFPTIAGAGPNGAIVHYRVTRSSNRRIAPGELFLVDSGAQYEDGTTDITRTIAVGTPSEEMREHFTRVLKGHIALARALFPDGTTGAQLDSFARQYLWAAGLDFDHGTGHGVGSYLSVHESPARISKLGTIALKRGMILSNEPGYYKTGAYGIRVENLVLVVEARAPVGAEKPLNAFETLTLAPIDVRLIEPRLLTGDELAWLDAYHTRVRDTLAPLVDADTGNWLGRATRPLGAA